MRPKARWSPKPWHQVEVATGVTAESAAIGANAKGAVNEAIATTADHGATAVPAEIGL